MSGRYLLDTNVVIALFANEPAATRLLSQAEEVFVSSVVIGELCYGARRSVRSADNLARIEEFAASTVVLGCDMETAWRYGEVKHRLRLKGRPIPENDVWIAAIAWQYDLVLATRDQHFQVIDGLRLIAG